MTYNPTATAIFRDKFNNQPNIMTPQIHEYRMIATGHLAIELSSGDGVFPGTKIWGVTVLNARQPSDDDTRFELSQSFESCEDANKYIETLRKWRPRANT